MVNDTIRKLVHNDDTCGMYKYVEECQRNILPRKGNPCRPFILKMELFAYWHLIQAQRKGEMIWTHFLQPI